MKAAIKKTSSRNPLIIREELHSKYLKMRPLYERLSINLSQAIHTFLDEKNISYLDITARTKDIDSAFEKIQKKEYKNPFEDIEDWCGLRVICYYPSDIGEIVSLLKAEFKVQLEEDTSSRLTPQEFGYRSVHLILTIKESWLEAPNYRGLEKLKAEVQIRTVLMHAWAEIEHKLAYKNKDQVPEKFQRKLSRLSAKFEEADEQFEELRQGLSLYRQSLKNDADTDSRSLIEQELNLDTLQALLNTYYPDRESSLEFTSSLLDELLRLGLKMSEIVEACEKTIKILPKVEMFEQRNESFPIQTLWAQVGAARTALDIANEKYYQARILDLGTEQFIEESVAYGRSLL